MSKEPDVLISDHDYDGIQEYDNPLPMWWLATFYGAIIFSFLYWIHYELSGGQTTWEEMKQDLAQIETLQKKAPKSQDKEDELLAMLSMDDIKRKGQEVYNGKCASCHGPELQGLIGPNLVDDYWLHGAGKITDVIYVIRKGVLEKGMPGWEAMMSEEELKSVSVYVFSKKGSTPKDPKPPQGQKIAVQ